jgi:hypothetical protein
MSILISYEVEFKANRIIRGLRGHYKMIKSSIKKENIEMLNIYAPNNRDPNYLKQSLAELKGKIEKNLPM